MTVSTWEADCNAGRAMAADMLKSARLDGSDALPTDAFFHLRSRLADLTGADVGFLSHLCERALLGEVAAAEGAS
jgi:hypothetical protein